jgi:hypothetical protein
MKRFAVVTALVCLAVFAAGGIAGASNPGVDMRLTNDCHPLAGCGAGYVSNYTLATGIPYSDRTLAECTIARGRQNEPAVAVDPRNTSLLLGSSNDYCGVYNQTDANGNPVPLGPIWLGYYRSQNAGTSWTSSLVPGYPDDTSYPTVSQRPRTASSGDPVIAWDNHGRAFFGSESSDDPAGTPKTFGDVWVARFVNPDGPDAPNRARDGLKWEGTAIVARGSSAPNLLGKFNDKTAIEVDRTGGGCDGNVYFSWSRFTGNGGVGIYFVRSTDHGVTFSSPIKLTSSIHDVQFPDIAVTGNGHVYVAFREFAAQGHGQDAIWIAKSTNCGRTFAPPVLVTTFIRSDAVDQADPEAMSKPQLQPDDPAGEEEGDAAGGLARDCGDFDAHCASGYTFFRRDTQVRATADQLDGAHEWIYMVYDATKLGTLAPTGTTYGTVGQGTGGQAATFFLRYDGAGGPRLGPSIIDNQGLGHQVFPDISADGGILHALWWDSRFDTCYSVTRPIGNCTSRMTTQSLDVFGAKSTDRGATWTQKSQMTDYRSNPNYEQFADRTVPFAGDYLWVTSLGDTAYGVWTDWRDTRPGTDPREAPEDEDAGTADVFQCRVLLSSTDKKGNTTTGWSGDRCPHSGGIDQNIYGDLAP